MSNKLMQNFAPIRRARALGERHLLNGTELYGLLGHISDRAWLHELYGPISDHEIELAEAQSLETAKPGIRIPDEYREFLHSHNGINIYFMSMYLSGFRSMNFRAGDASIQPNDIIKGNVIARPRNINWDKWPIFLIGGYQEGSRLVLEVDSGRVFRTPDRDDLSTILNTWPSVRAMLESEINRFQRLFESCEGLSRFKVGEPSLPPPESENL